MGRKKSNSGPRKMSIEQFDKLFEEIQYQNDYYIHYNNIHNAQKRVKRGQATPGQQLLWGKNTQVSGRPRINQFDIWSQYHDKAYFQLLGQFAKDDYISRFKELFNEKNGIGALEGLSAVMEISEEEFVKNLTTKITNGLNSNFKENLLLGLHEVVNGKNSDDGTLKSAIKEFVSHKNIKNLNNILQILKNAVELIEDKDVEGGLGAILANVAFTSKGKMVSTGGVVGIGKKLNNQLSAYIERNNNATGDQKILLKAAQYLKNFAYVLQKGKFKTTKKDLSEAGLTTQLSNGFISTTLAESFGGKIAESSLAALAKVVETSGAHITDTGHMITEDTKKIYKTDFRIDDVEVKSEAIFGKNLGNFIIDLGFSSKFYVNQSFSDLKKKITGVYSSGRGPSLAQAIQDIFPNATRQTLYFAYNYIAHDDLQDQNHQQQFNNRILKREITRLFATAGKGDLTNFLLINGKIYSMYSIIQYVTNEKYNFYLSRSQQRTVKNDQQGVYLHIEGRSTLRKNNVKDEYPNPMIAAWHRSHKLNETMRRSTISAEVHLGKLAAKLAKENII